MRRPGGTAEVAGRIAGFSVALLAPIHRGDELTASATEVARTGRSGVYDVSVVNAQGRRVAVSCRCSHTMRGKPAVPAMRG
jgi:acyl-CoA thioesterase